MSYWTLLRIFVGLATLLYLTPHALITLIAQLRSGYDPIETSVNLVVTTLAVLGWWFVFRGNHRKSRDLMIISLKGGLIFFGIGFSVGFFGPIIFKPSSNQGPLLGIFVTGPIGFCIGVLAGWLYAIAFKVTDRD